MLLSSSLGVCFVTEVGLAAGLALAYGSATALGVSSIGLRAGWR